MWVLEVLVLLLTRLLGCIDDGLRIRLRWAYHNSLWEKLLTANRFVRAAEHGCLVASRSEGYTWLPAFHAPNAAEVVNTTGAGSAFLGGFAVGLQMEEGIRGAACYGIVAASFAVEQIGR